jgi:hypothetical protein
MHDVHELVGLVERILIQTHERHENLSCHQVDFTKYSIGRLKVCDAVVCNTKVESIILLRQVRFEARYILMLSADSFAELILRKNIPFSFEFELQCRDVLN